MKKRQIKLIIVGAAIVLISIGATFAWWTASTQVKQTITMGDLAIEATMENLADELNYEPGLNITQEGTVRNKGSIEAIIRLDSASKIKFVGSSESVVADPTAIDLSIKPAGGEGYWFKDASGQAYLLLSPGETATLAIETNLSGDTISNEYMGATIDIIGDLKATQVLAGAIQAEFGIDFESLEDYSLIGARSSQTNGQKILHDLINRGK